MKIIDLLNKIANGEEVPHIQYDDIEAYLGADGYLKDNYGDNVEWWIDKKWLNTEVEILEEKKIPEKMDYLGLNIREGNLCKKDTIMLCDYIDYQTQIINEIIDYLKSKGEE